MKSIILLIIVMVIAGSLLRVLNNKSSARSVDGEWPYYAKKSMSAPEQILYFRLLRAFPDHIVLAQVGLSRILGVTRGNNVQAWNNRINRMSIDFAICAKDSAVLAAIELDDATHQRSARKVADAKKDKALAAAGIRILRFQAKSLPDEAALLAAVGKQTPPVTGTSAIPAST